MKGLWLQDGQLRLRQDLAPPECGSDDLLLNVRAAGICGTDLELLAGYASFTGIPGHEFVGQVVGGPQEWVGKRVVASINLGCGQCNYCAQGLTSHCVNREVIGIRYRNGAFAEQVSVPAANAYPVPDHVPDQVAVLVEPLAAALEIVEQVHFNGTERVMIVGAGRLAQLIAQVLMPEVSRLEVLVRNPTRVAAFSPLGLATVTEPGAGYDLVVECSGSASGLGIALGCVRPRGILVMKSTMAEGKIPPLNTIVINELTVIGSRCGPFDKAIAWIGAGRLSTSHLAFERFALSQHRAAFRRARSTDVYKVLLLPGRMR